MIVFFLEVSATHSAAAVSTRILMLFQQPGIKTRAGPVRKEVVVQCDFKETLSVALGDGVRTESFARQKSAQSCLSLQASLTLSHCLGSLFCG